MPSIDVTDHVVIDARREAVFPVLCDYPRVRDWFPGYRIDLLTDGAVGEGARLRHEMAAGGGLMTTRFVRTIRRFEPPSLIEETYDEGDLLGRGCWSLESRGDGATQVSYRCAVRSNTPWMHLGVALTGHWGHSWVYQRLLRALKARVEGGVFAT